MTVTVNENFDAGIPASFWQYATALGNVAPVAGTVRCAVNLASVPIITDGVTWTENQAYLGVSSNLTASDIYIKFKVRFTGALPSAYSFWNIIESGFVGQLRVWSFEPTLEPRWMIHYRRGGISAAVEASIPVALDTDYVVQYHYGSNGVVELWVNGALVASANDADTFAAPAWGDILVGMCWNGLSPWDAFRGEEAVIIDDLVISDQYIDGAGAVLTLSCTPTHGFLPWVSTFQGTLKDSGGVPIPNAPINFESSIDGGTTWSLMFSTPWNTDASGAYSVDVEFTAPNGWVTGSTGLIRATTGVGVYSALVIVTMDSTTPPLDWLTPLAIGVTAFVSTILVVKVARGGKKKKRRR